MKKVTITYEELYAALLPSIPSAGMLARATWRELVAMQPEEFEDGCHYMSSSQVVYRYMAARGIANHFWLKAGMAGNISFLTPARPMRKLVPVEEEE